MQLKPETYPRVALLHLLLIEQPVSERHAQPVRVTFRAGLHKCNIEIPCFPSWQRERPRIGLFVSLPHVDRKVNHQATQKG